MSLTRMVFIIFQIGFLSADIIFQKVPYIITSFLRQTGASEIYFIEMSQYEDILKQKEKLFLIKQLGSFHQKNIFVQTRGFNSHNFNEENGPIFISLFNSINTRARFEKISGFCRREFTYLIFLRTEEEFLFLDQLAIKAYLRLDCYFIVAGIKDKKVYLKEIYNIAPMKVKINDLGQIDEALNTLSVYFLRRRANMENIIFPLAASDNNIPMYMTEKNSEGKIINIKGLYATIWQILEERLNFRSRFLQATDGSWGVLLANGSWDGMLGMVHRGEALVALGDYSFFKKRLQDFDYFVPFIYTRNEIYVRSQKIGYEDFTLIEKIEAYFWILLILLIIISTLILSFIRYKVNLLGLHDPNQHSSAFFVIFTMFCQQAPPSLPKSLSCRILYLSCQLLTLIFIASFSAHLILSSFIIEFQPPPFKNFLEMLQLNDFRLSMLSKSGQLYDFQNTKDPILHQVYEKFILPHIDSLPETELVGLKQVCNKANYAHLTWNFLAYGIKKYLSCQLQTIPGVTSIDLLSIIIEKNSCYTKIFNYYLMNMKESGIINRIIFEELEQPANNEYERISLSSINFKHVLILIYILIFGMNLSLIILILEIMIHKYIPT